MLSAAVTVFSRTILIFACVYNVANAHEYTVHVDESMQRMEVEARFDERVIRIAARSDDAARYLIGAHDCETGERLRARGRQLRLPSGGIDCLRYSVDLERAAREERRNSTLSSSNVIVSTAAWLWRPRLDDRSSIRVRFDMARSVDVSMPWRPIAGESDVYELTTSPQSATAPTVFGDFEYHEADIPGATLRITVLNGERPLDSDALVEWVAEAASHITLVYGTFPNPSPSVVVIPVGSRSWSDAPVPFGRVIRDGGETIELFVNENRSIEDYYGHWTATHEFSHLMTPYIASRHRWVSEGFAQYYQNLLLARAGHYSERRAWQELYEGFERGRGSAVDRTPNEVANGSWRSGTMRVYWTGAVVALLGDVELREASNGAQSLDTILQELMECCLPSDRMWSGPEFYERLDEIAGRSVFMPLYRRYSDSTDFPDAMPALARLGVIVEDERVTFDDDAELSGIRREMTQPRESAR